MDRSAFSRRIDAFKEMMAGRGVDIAFVQHPANVRYLSGASSPHTGLFVPYEKSPILLAPAADAPLLEESLAWPIRPYSSEEERLGMIREELVRHCPGRGAVGFEARHLPYETYRAWARRLAPSWTKVRDVSEALDRLRAVKGPEEVEAARAAAHGATGALAGALELLRDGTSAEEVAGGLALKAGGRALVRVNAGRAAAASPGLGGEVSPGRPAYVELVLEKEGYHAGLCRTVVPGGADDEFRRAAEEFSAVYEEALAGLRPGLTMAEATDPLRKGPLRILSPLPVLTGIGLEAAERPRSDLDGAEVLVPGMVLYWCVAAVVGDTGIRVADTVLITEEGHEVLTGLERDPC